MFKDGAKCTSNGPKYLLNEHVVLLKGRAKRHYGSQERYLCHHAVCTCVLLILEDDVGVVVGSELLEALRVAGNFPFVSPTGP